MSRTKKVTRARRHIAALQSKLMNLEHRLRISTDELDYTRDNLAPHLAKLATVKIGVPWEQYADEPPLPTTYFDGACRQPQMAQTIRTPTSRSLQVSLAFSRELIERIAQGHEQAVVREMVRQVERVAKDALLQIVPSARKGRVA